MRSFHSTSYLCFQKILITEQIKLKTKKETNIFTDNFQNSEIITSRYIKRQLLDTIKQKPDREPENADGEPADCGYLGII